MIVKYKSFIMFILGFVIATGISIYKQHIVASNANRQISIANTVISDLQEKQKSLQSANNYLHYQVLQLQSELSNYEYSIQIED